MKNSQRSVLSNSSRSASRKALTNQPAKPSVAATLQRLNPGTAIPQLSANDVLNLQRAVGNRAVARFLAPAAQPKPQIQAKPSHSPALGGVVQREVEANNFKDFVGDQFKLQQYVVDNKTFPKGKSYTTLGFEHEFAQMTDGPLMGLTHQEVAKSAPPLPYRQLPFILETDAGNALELVSPPFLIETLKDRPVPLAADVEKVDNLMKAALTHYTGQDGMTLGKLVTGLKSDVGVDFSLETIDLVWESWTDKASKNAKAGAQVSEEGLADIPLKTSKKNGGVTTQINFATDAVTYDSMTEAQGFTGPVADIFNALAAELEHLIFPLLTKAPPSQGLTLFKKQLVRTLSGLISVPYIEAQRLIKKEGFGLMPDKPSPSGLEAAKGDLMTIRTMASRVKDISPVWIKDNLINYGLSVLSREEWGIIQALMTNEALYEGLQTVKVNLKNETIEGGIRELLVNAARTLAGHADEIQKLKDLNVFFNPKKGGFLSHDEALIGARQDTYISAPNVQMPGMWDDRRLHVVESRHNKMAETIRELKKQDPAYDEFFRLEEEARLENERVEQERIKKERELMRIEEEERQRAYEEYMRQEALEQERREAQEIWEDRLARLTRNERKRMERTQRFQAYKERASAITTSDEMRDLLTQLRREKDSLVNLGIKIESVRKWGLWSPRNWGPNGTIYTDDVDLGNPFRY